VGEVRTVRRYIDKRRYVELRGAYYRVFVPLECPFCGCPNMKVYGSRFGADVRFEVRCMRCGKPLWEWRWLN